MAKNTYDCSDVGGKPCPGACCGNIFEHVHASEDEIVAMAELKGMDLAKFRDKYTRADPSSEEDLRHDEEGRPLRLIRRKADPVVFGKDDETPKPDICVFLDLKTRRCGVYHARPSTCSIFPGGPSCGYYDFLKFIREHQGNDEVYIKAEIIIP